jgi:hypothetical protein
VTGRDWREWHQGYDDPQSSISKRLVTVRGALQGLLEAADGTVRLLSLCAGDGRDTLPVVAASGVEVHAVLVELDESLAARAREAASAGIEVRTADAGTTASYADAAPVDVLMACGIFGNVTDHDIARTVAAFPSLLASGGHVVWTRGNNVRDDPTSYDGDPAEMVRRLVVAAGLEEVAFVSDPSGFRVGVARWPGPDGVPTPDQRLFEFV